MPLPEPSIQETRNLQEDVNQYAVSSLESLLKKKSQLNYIADLHSDASSLSCYGHGCGDTDSWCVSHSWGSICLQRGFSTWDAIGILISWFSVLRVVLSGLCIDGHQCSQAYTHYIPPAACLFSHDKNSFQRLPNVPWGAGKQICPVVNSYLRTWLTSSVSLLLPFTAYECQSINRLTTKHQNLGTIT
jgi:hypothetical protein